MERYTNPQNGYDTMLDSHIFFFACGALAGAAVALMFAPARGEETREFLARRGRDVKSRGREMLHEHGERLTSAIERGRESATQMGERLSQAVEQGKAGYRDAVRRGQNAASHAMQAVEEGGGQAIRDAARGTEPLS
jgi:gas vesicle protein